MIQNHSIKRCLEYYWTDPDWLSERMIFLSGPRQVGKTTLVKQKLCPKNQGYFNWDDRKIRRLYQNDPHFFAGIDSPWICFDEIHRIRKWKDISKGIFDVFKDRYHFIVTGSALLKTFKRSGDSLVGRYFHTQLFPLNLGDFTKKDFFMPDSWEKLSRQSADLADAKELETLLNFGGFPEPFFKGTQTFYKRWSREHIDLIMTEDLRDLSRATELDKIELIPELLAQRTGQLISYSNLARDLETSHVNVKRWLSILERLQVIFAVTPYAKRINRAYVKECKYYFMDWRFAAQNHFENYVAASLLRAATLYSDRFGETVTMHFIRTHDGSEVDFLLCHNNKPWVLIEAKEGTPEPTRAAYRFSHELGVPCLMVTLKPNFYREIRGHDNQKIFQISWAKIGQMLG